MRSATRSRPPKATPFSEVAGRRLPDLARGRSEQTIPGRLQHRAHVRGGRRRRHRRVPGCAVRRGRPLARPGPVRHDPRRVLPDRRQHLPRRHARPGRPFHRRSDVPRGRAVDRRRTQPAVWPAAVGHHRHPVSRSPVSSATSTRPSSGRWAPASASIAVTRKPTDPVDCSEPHAFQVTGVIDLGVEFGAAGSGPAVAERRRAERLPEDDLPGAHRPVPRRRRQARRRPHSTCSGRPWRRRVGWPGAEPSVCYIGLPDRRRLCDPRRGRQGRPADQWSGPGTAAGRTRRPHHPDTGAATSGRRAQPDRDPGPGRRRW